MAILFTTVDGATDVGIFHASLRRTERLLKLQEVQLPLDGFFTNFKFKIFDFWLNLSTYINFNSSRTKVTDALPKKKKAFLPDFIPSQSVCRNGKVFIKQV